MVLIRDRPLDLQSLLMNPSPYNDPSSYKWSLWIFHIWHSTVQERVNIYGMEDKIYKRKLACAFFKSNFWSHFLLPAFSWKLAWRPQEVASGRALILLLLFFSPLTTPCKDILLLNTTIRKIPRPSFNSLVMCARMRVLVWFSLN